MGPFKIDLVIEVYTNKQQLVGVYLDKGRVSDTTESAEAVISETPWSHSKHDKQTKKQHIYKLTPALSIFPQLLLAAQRKNIS